jgi:hypothetical protein
MMQGRRDFAFGLGQALRAYRALAGPKQLWIGLHGHAPSTFPAADTPAMLAEGVRWFDRFLRGDTSAALPRPVAVSPENWRGQPQRFAGIPKVVVRRGGDFRTVSLSRAGIPSRAATAYRCRRCAPQQRRSVPRSSR